MADPMIAAMLAEAAALSDAPSPPATALFPAPVVASRTGGVSGVTGLGTTSKLFSVVKVACADPLVCFGQIGTGGTFCLRGKDSCPFKAHNDTKVPYFGTSENYVFICHAVGVSAYVDPAVSESLISEDVWDRWKDKTLPLEDWRREFQAVTTTDDKNATSEDIEEEAKTFISADNFKTPGKRKRGVLKFEGDDEYVEVSPTTTLYERVLPEERSELDKVMQSGNMKRGTVTGVVANLETNIINLQKGFAEVVSASSTRFQSNEDALNLVSRALHNLRSGIGAPIELMSMFVAPTMWGTLSLVSDELARVGGLAQGLMKMVTPFHQETSTKFDAVNSTNSAITQIVNMLMTSLKKLTNDHQTTSATVASLVDQMSQGKAKRARTGKEANAEGSVEDLMSMMLNNSIAPEPVLSMDSPPPRMNTSSPRGEQGSVITCDENSRFTEELFQKLNQLMEDVNILKISAEASAVKFGNLGLRNLQECSRWVSEHYTEARYGLVIDPLALLDRIFGDDEVDPMTQLKTLESRAKLNIDTGAESSSITSLGHSRPRIFHFGRPTMTCDQRTSRLNKLCKPVHWKTGGEGVRNYIIKQMNVLQTSIGSDIMYSYGNRPDEAKAQMIATLSLTASVAFITQLLNYIDALFEKLHVYSKFTVETAWSLTMQVLDRICSDLYVPKEGVANGMKGDRRSICAHVLWANFRTLDVAQNYLDFNFENHPAISSEFIKFLATNSGFEKVERLEETVCGLKTAMTGALADAKEASKKSDTASTKCGDMNSAITALTRRVKTVEDRCAR